jgi:hypothetical protein
MRSSVSRGVDCGWRGRLINSRLEYADNHVFLHLLMKLSYVVVVVVVVVDEEIVVIVVVIIIVVESRLLV